MTDNEKDVKDIWSSAEQSQPAPEPPNNTPAPPAPDTPPVKPKENTMAKKYTVMAWVFAVLVILVALPLNLLADKLNLNWDMTPNKLYTSSLSTTTQNLLNSIDNDINIYFLYDMEELNTDYEVGKVLRNILMKYDEYDNVTLISGNPDESPQLFADFTSKNLELSYGDVIVQSGDLYKQISGSDMTVYDYNEDTDTYTYYVQAENKISSAIEYVVTGVVPYVYFVQGHGELSPDDCLTSMCDALSIYDYEVDILNVGAEGSIPENTQAIIFAAPQSDITETEKQIINNYLDNGGGIIFLMSPNESDELYPNICEIMQSFGIYMDYDIVYESDPDMYYNDDAYTIGAYLSESENVDWITEAQELVSQGYYAVMPPSRSFYAPDSSTNSNLLAEPLIYSTSTAVGEPYGGNYTEDDRIKNENLILSAFADDGARNNAKMLVMGNAECITDELMQEQYTIVPASVFLSSIAWMSDSSLELDIDSISQKLDYMQFESKADTNKVLAVIIVVPLVIAGVGLAVWLRRRNA